MLSLSDLSEAELIALYNRVADLSEMVAKFTPTSSVTGIVHHAENFKAAIEARITEVEKAPRPAARTRQSSEVK